MPNGLLTGVLDSSRPVAFRYPTAVRAGPIAAATATMQSAQETALAGVTQTAQAWTSTPTATVTVAPPCYLNMVTDKTNSTAIGVLE